MSEELSRTKPRFGLGQLVSHPHFGNGRILAYQEQDYVVLFKGGETRRVGFSFENLAAAGSGGDPELDRIKEAVRQVLGDQGWLEVELELAPRWVGGTLRMIPGKEEVQAREVPIEVFFKKIIGIREKLRVLEQKINNHPRLEAEEKLELEGYITRCYGSLTSFNVLFDSRQSQFVGQKGE